MADGKPRDSAAISDERIARRRAGVEALFVAALVTTLVTACSALVPEHYVGTLVGLVFLGATWTLVWQKDDARVVLFGLSLGGLVLTGPLDRARVAGSALRAIGWACVLAGITFGPFYLGWSYVWRPRGSFSLHGELASIASDAAGQLLLVALPEEAFYRGYLQSRLDEALPGFGWRNTDEGQPRVPRRVRIFGASVGPAILVSSGLFALGHLATIHHPARLAVFFPSLAFGWLRYRTKGIGAALVFHAMCNLFSEALGRGFHLY
jgi:membrane protease YdiL (CAAX protease family)